MPKLTKNDIFREFRRKEIIDAAHQVIQKHGYDFTLDQVAREAGLAKGTIYLYFHDKDDLVFSIITDSILHLSRTSEEQLKIAGSLHERLQRMILSQIRFFMEHQQLFLYFHLKRRTSPHVLKKKIYSKIRKDFNAYLSILAGYLKEAMEAGEIRRLDPPKLAAVMVEIVNGVLQHHIFLGRKFDPERETAFILDVFFNGIEGTNRSRGGKRV